ncbi:malignant T-cell-amplified sequence 1 isoform X2 [Dermacentor albipictus]|uniref:malignant T-cell-amplified sequence 1 isoform X2 n=1 Tax=Dermacentor albipictus TaxID=60249 RepID=UPI0038FC497E
MFKKFDEKEHVSGITQLKSSVQKAIKGRILEQFPSSENYINQILPKKDLLRTVKCHDHVEILINGAGELLFFRQREGPYFPTLRLLHKYPFLCPWLQVDKGAIRFVLSGANIMCPGLTSPGAKMTRVPKGTVVVSFLTSSASIRIGESFRKCSCDLPLISLTHYVCAVTFCSQ